METPYLPPRADPAALSAAAIQRQAPDALSVQADTTRPVLAVAKADASRASGQEDFQPLDTFEVGDNDYVPVPPEPPRQATVLALIASAAEVEPAAKPDPAPPEPALTASLRTIEAGPGNPTVDIRR